MLKKILISLSVLLVIAALAFFIFMMKTKDKFYQSSLFNAVSPSTPMFIRTNNCCNFCKLAGENNEMFETLFSIKSLKNEFNNICFLPAFIDSVNGIEKIIKNKELIVTFDQSGKDEMLNQYLISLPAKSDFNHIHDLITNYVYSRGGLTSKRKYNNGLIYSISGLSWIEGEYFFAYQKGVLIFCSKALAIEETLRQIDDVSIETDNELSPLMKTVNYQASFNLFVNHKTIGQFFSEPLSDSFRIKASRLKTYSAWSEFDITIKKGKLLVNGFSNGSAGNNYFSHVLINQQPGIPKISSILPHDVPYFSYVFLSDLEKYFSDYEQYLSKKNLFLQYQDGLKKIEKETGFDLKKIFIDISANEFAVSGIHTGHVQKDEGIVFIIKTQSGSHAINRFIDLQRRYLEVNNIDISDWEKEYQVDEQTSFQCYRFPYNNLAQLIFGQLFSGANTSWFSVYDNYLIFSDSFSTLGKIIHSNILGETLSSNIAYNRFESTLNLKTNYLFFCNPGFSLPLANIVFNNEIGADISQNIALGKFKMLAWQVSSSGSMLYNNASLIFNPEIKARPQTVWQSHLNTPFEFKPQFVKNHDDIQNKEIILQDNGYNLYLINNIGRILWQIRLSGKIIGEIHQVDRFKNSKLQYLFNTSDKIYMIDRNGNNVKPFPLSLRATATNPVAVFDYEGTKNYRFMVACSDKLIYAYDASGNIVEGWENPKTDHEVIHPLQHFVVDGKDYIIASDKMKDYFFDRRGSIRVKTDIVYNHSSNNTVYLEKRTNLQEPRIVTTDNKGNIHRTYFNGSHEMVEFMGLSENHFFVAGNLDVDESLEYIFVDDKRVFVTKNSGKPIFSKKLDYNVPFKPNIYYFSYKEKKIGITCKEDNKIFLFDINGNLHEGFPLDGSSEFSIGFISNESTNFNLLVASPDGYLYNYYVE
ncbi:MAG: hypothetical protein JW798_13460 [Prolixibacteraceae bacterium]|nr:hypothetical protein [Prolixibacteraceae bacterium]